MKIVPASVVPVLLVLPLSVTYPSLMTRVPLTMRSYPHRSRYPFLEMVTVTPSAMVMSLVRYVAVFHSVFPVMVLDTPVASSKR